MNPEKPAVVLPGSRPKEKPTANRSRKQPENQLSPGGPDEEVSALIEALHENVQRLEDLTAGEVDAIADRHGRTFLLRRAQESLRASDAAKQAAILNALPAHIALLDPEGFIISVNDAWRRFASANVLQGLGHGVGLNYLGICDNARGVDSSEAQPVAKGIRSVLGREVKIYSIEYPCHSPTEQHWFLMTVTPLSEDSPNGVVVMHADITERKRGEAQLLRFSAAMDSIADAIYVVDPASMRFIHVNDAACRIQDMTREALIALAPEKVLSTSRAELKRTYDAIIASGEDAKPLELLRDRKDGSQVWIELRHHSQRVGERWTIITLVRDITQRKRAAEELRTSEHEQRQLAEQLQIERSRLVVAQRVAKVGSWETDIATQSVIWSDETHRIHETDPATFRPTHPGFIELVHPEDRARVDEAFWRSLGQRADYKKTEHRLLLPDGRIKFVEERWRVYFDKQKKPVRAVGTCQDITERKRAEMTSIRLAAIVESSDDAIISKDLSSIITSWNKGAENIFGYTTGEMVGTSILRLIPMDRHGEEKSIMEKINRGESVEHFDTVRQTRDGRLIDVSITISPIKDVTGKVIGVSKMARDITERKRAERRLQASEAQFRHLIEQADDGIVTNDAVGNIVQVNSRACELLGYTEEEMIGMDGIVTYPDEERELHARRMQAAANGETLRFERMVKRKDGSTFAAEVSLKKRDDSLVQAIFHDITTRRNQEQKISRLSRIHAVVSGINAAIVRIRDRRELFQEACRIIVEHGQFSLGWIAVLDHATGKLTAVAQAGMSEHAAVGSDFFNGIVGLVPAGVAEIVLREKRSAFDNVIEDMPGVTGVEPRQDSLKVRQAAIELGAKSVIGLPLIVEGGIFGILHLYAPERDFFDEEEVKLLTDLAGDISFGLEFIAKNEKVDYLAYYDVLTGLANRHLFLERVAQYMRIAASAGRKLAVYLIDLERFKNINDSLGQSAGDTLLRQVAEWLTRNAEDAMLVARVGADHFAVVLPEVNQTSDVARVIETTMESFLDHPFHLSDSIFRVAAKAGVALFPDDGTDAHTLYRHAEAALKKAKSNGERYLFYTQQMTEMVAVKLTLENQLRQALDNEEFVLHYQPKVNLVSGKLIGAEALIRWNDPRTGLVAPGRFIPILEETGLIYEVGRWALRKAIEDYLRWHSAGLPAVRVAVNVSPLQLRNRGFIAEIEQTIGVDLQEAAGLELEITESLIMEDVKHSITSLQAIRAMGVRIAIDDFGTGFSSLSYLAKLPVDTLKIDRSFVIDMTAAQEGLALVSTIISLAHSLKLNVVAEGVETEEQSRLLRLLACDEMQGYLFSKPVPREIFETKFLASPDK